MGSVDCEIKSIIRGDCDINVFFSSQVESTPEDFDIIEPESILKAAVGANKI